MTTRAAGDNAITRQLQSALDLAQTSGASPELLKVITTARVMLEKRDAFTVEASSDHTETCKEIEEETFTRDWKADFDQGKTPWHFKPGMVSGRLEGQFLKSLVSMQKARRILEVGMFTGYSALSMAEALPADGELVTLDICEMLKPLVEKLTESSPHASKINIIIGDPIEQMKQMAEAGDKFDVVFLDAVKTYYKDILKILFDSNLLSPGGTVLIDNAYHMGATYTPSRDDSVVRELVDIIKGRRDLHSVLVPMADGVLMVRRLADVEGDTA